MQARKELLEAAKFKRKEMWISLKEPEEGFKTSSEIVLPI
jgi:hypothetical protein